MNLPNSTTGAVRRDRAHGSFSSTGEPGLGPVKVLVRQQDVLSDPIHQWPSAEIADEIADQGPEHLGQRGDGDDGKKI